MFHVPGHVPLIHVPGHVCPMSQGHRKKMSSRRLDYDYKISQHEKGKVTGEELQVAEDKFNESMQAADMGMKKFVQTEVRLEFTSSVFNM